MAKKLAAKIVNSNDDGELKKFKLNNNKLVNKSMRNTKPWT